VYFIVKRLFTCDVLQLYRSFKEFNEVHKRYKNNLPESEIIDIVDGVCNDKDTFNTLVHLPSCFYVKFVTSPARAVAKYCDEHVCLSMCLSVCKHISRATHVIFKNSLPNFLCMLPVVDMRVT